MYDENTKHFDRVTANDILLTLRTKIEKGEFFLSELPGASKLSKIRHIWFLKMMGKASVIMIGKLHNPLFTLYSVSFNLLEDSEYEDLENYLNKFVDELDETIIRDLTGSIGCRVDRTSNGGIVFSTYKRLDSYPEWEIEEILKDIKGGTNGTHGIHM